MKTECCSLTLCALALSLTCAVPLAAKSAPAPRPTEVSGEKDVTARPGLTAAQVDAAVAKAAQLKTKMTIAQVEQVMGKLTVAGKGGALVDMVMAMPLAPDIEVTGTDGVYRFDFTANEKGRFLLASWTLLPGAQPSR